MNKLNRYKKSIIKVLAKILSIIFFTILIKYLIGISSLENILIIIITIQILIFIEVCKSSFEINELKSEIDVLRMILNNTVKREKDLNENNTSKM